MSNHLYIIGTMSGTSLDGIDCSLVYSNGIDLKRTGFNIMKPYDNKTLELLTKVLNNLDHYLIEQNKLKKVVELITIDHAKVIHELIDKSNITPSLIGFHGQTIHHDPKKLKTIQLGDPLILKKIFKSNIVFNFRQKDIDKLGQGAPLAPIYHKRIIEELMLNLPTVIVNIGGISNITYWDENNLIGFDTGPGNKLMDNYINLKFNEKYDIDGKIAKEGIIDHKLIKYYCDQEFYKHPPPKSLDIADLFNNEIYKKIIKLKASDCLATLSFLTAETITMSFKFLPLKPKTILIVGGGQKNSNLVNNIKNLNKCEVYTAEEKSLPGDFIEAELIAYLSARKFYNLTSSFPTTTGCTSDTVLGEII